MNTKIKFGCLITILILLYGCGKKSEIEKESRKILIKYKNGNSFCEGIYIVNKKSGLPINSAGIWKFYYPNGILERYTKYDEDGNIIEDKDYFFDGCLAGAEIIQNDTIFRSDYYENGEISSESVKKKSEIENNENNEDLIISEKYYFKNGTLSYSENVQDNIATYFFFYEDGNIKTEYLVKTEVIDQGEEGESETNYSTIKEYYPNGHLYKMKSYKDDLIQGEELIWDEKGQLTLTVNYKDGFILAK